MERDEGWAVSLHTNVSVVARPAELASARKVIYKLLLLSAAIGSTDDTQMMLLKTSAYFIWKPDEYPHFLKGQKQNRIQGYKTNQIMWMKVLSHPGHGNSMCCIKCTDGVKEEYNNPSVSNWKDVFEQTYITHLQCSTLPRQLYIHSHLGSLSPNIPHEGLFQWPYQQSSHVSLRTL